MAVVGDTVGGLPVPPVALGIRDVADGLGLLWDDGCDHFDSDMDMGSSPLGDRGRRRLEVSRGGSARPKAGAPVVLFPAVSILPVEMVCPVHGGTIPDSVDWGHLSFDD